MKRLIFPLLLFVLFVIVSPVAVYAADNRSVTILYTGSVQGAIEPCFV
jgi:hypothetical protein